MITSHRLPAPQPASIEPDETEQQELVDAVVCAIDRSRSDDVARLREALESFGLGRAFDDELRITSWTSSEPEHLCWVCREAA